MLLTDSPARSHLGMATDHCRACHCYDMSADFKSQSISIRCEQSGSFCVSTADLQHSLQLPWPRAATVLCLMPFGCFGCCYCCCCYYQSYICICCRCCCWFCCNCKSYGVFCAAAAATLSPTEQCQGYIATADELTAASQKANTSPACLLLLVLLLLCMCVCWCVDTCLSCECGLGPVGLRVVVAVLQR